MNNLELDVELKIVLPFDNKIINNEKKYQLHSIINDSNQLEFYLLSLKQPFSTQVVVSSTNKTPLFLIKETCKFINDISIYIKNIEKDNMTQLYTHTNYIVKENKNIDIPIELDNCKQILIMNGILIDSTYFHDKTLKKGSERLFRTSSNKKKRWCACF